MSLVGRSLPSRWREGAARAVDAPVFFWLRPRPRRPPRSESVAAGRVPTKSVLQSERENYDSNNKRPGRAKLLGRAHKAAGERISDCKIPRDIGPPLQDRACLCGGRHGRSNRVAWPKAVNMGGVPID